MAIIDEEGRLFGLVNVVDAIVVLLVVAVAIAGITFALQPDLDPNQNQSQTTVAVTLQLTSVPPYLADAIHAGQSETAGNRTIAEITDVQRAPAPFIVTDQDGKVHVRDHPTELDLTVEAELQARETSNGLAFKEGPLRIGATVVLDLGNVTVEPTVTEL